MTSPGPRHRVLIADERPEVRMLLRARFEMSEDIEVAAEAGTGEETIALVAHLTPAAVVIDLDMVDMEAERAIPAMRELAPGMRILLFTASDNVRALRDEGAPDAVVTKGQSFSYNAVVAQLRELLASGPYDVVRLTIGRVPLEQSVTAFDSWVEFNARVMDALVSGEMLSPQGLGGATGEQVQALMTVYAHIGHRLARVARDGSSEVFLVVHVLHTTAKAARCALLALDPGTLVAYHAAWGYAVPDSAAGALHLIRERLLEVLPASPGGGDLLTGAFRPVPAPEEATLTERDRNAAERDRQAERRDTAAAAREAVCETLAKASTLLAGQAVGLDGAHHRKDLECARGERQAAAADRELAARDRRAAAMDRQVAVRDRVALSRDSPSRAYEGEPGRRRKVGRHTDTG